MNTVTYDAMNLKDFKSILKDNQMEYLTIVVTKNLRTPERYFDLIKDHNIVLEIENGLIELDKHNKNIKQKEQREIKLNAQLNERNMKMNAIMNKPSDENHNPQRRTVALSEKAVYKDSGNYRISHLMHLLERRAEAWVKNPEWEETEDGLFGFIPKFQRGLVWTLKQKQDLIMSMLNDIPIGVFYVNELTDFFENATLTYELDSILYDGQQRFTAIKDFLENDFPLNLDGKDVYAKELHLQDIAKIKGTLVPIYITYISNLDDLIDYYVFINTGGTLHTPEDIEKARQYQKHKNGNDA